jgi:hypothetical protein
MLFDADKRSDFNSVNKLSLKSRCESFSSSTKAFDGKVEILLSFYFKISKFFKKFKLLLSIDEISFPVIESCFKFLLYHLD